MKQIGIISALLSEAACLTNNVPEPEQLISFGHNISLIVSGMGRERAKRAAMQLINANVDVLISWGIAGALSDGIEPGDLIVPETIIGTDGKIFHTAKHWRASVVNRLTDCPKNIYLGQLADSMYIMTTVSDKSELRNENNAQAVDMESAALAEVAAQYEIPYIVIRAISDSSDMTIPDTVARFTDAYGRVRLRKLLSTLIARPNEIPHILKLARGFKEASKTLEWAGHRLDHVLRID